MASLNLANPSASGSAEAYNAANAGGDSFPIPAPILIKMKNANGGAARNVTLVAQKPCSQGVLHNVVITIPAASVRDVRVTDIERFATASRRIQMTYDSEADLSFQAFQAG